MKLGELIHILQALLLLTLKNQLKFIANANATAPPANAKK
jgi:hypothetical protein